jgi:hypothetical protein
VKEYIIDDSSRHKNANTVINKDYSIRVGVVREHIYLPDRKQTRYLVEVNNNNRVYILSCMRTSRFGGLYNYEEYNLRGFAPGISNISYNNPTIVPGDMVVVAAVNGDSRDGIILGNISHFGRGEVLPANSDIAFVNEFNGIETMINNSGEYRRTFKGQPTNLAKLNEIPNGKRYPAAEYNIDVGFSYYEFDKTGSYTLTDNTTDKAPQYIKLDKPNGKIEIVSGKTSLIIDKGAQSYTIINKTTTFNSTDSWNLNTKVTNINSTDAISAKTKDIKTEGKWTQKGDMAITGKVEVTGDTKVSGDFKNEGEALLAGGANPLIYDIVLIMGTGNLGAPVISMATVLKTVKTKAT